ncbi:NAD-dependent epimerase/dehydratase family protein [Neorhizobium sp. S3-V5DH]|uniref:NAD-dependent epimerase/dehydratase family protein n=1 Tax=Neorhizobium sp. S3-V5DH TaxID=2485166 RepID=UPI00104FB006|nr:NAD-dependent epimerase/dehydratase family protein [Neorhizobium sp. S3-V5DH]TCV68573.1 nucleoside-diphosphate-sugar epimerase [Neorhizobium sp. S3-V5DH]
MSGEIILVTGATGRIGRVVVADLVERGYSVRATTSKALMPSRPFPANVDWRRIDFATDRDLAELVEGCGAVLHLAAELGNMQRMIGVNAEATERLARAAEDAGIRVFCYTSSVAVYGSSSTVTVDEDSPVLTPDRDVASEYWALDYVRAYGRTKLAGELAIKRVAGKARYVILRPAVVVDLSQIIGVRDWNVIKRLLASHRHSHHLYVEDLSDALIWFMERGLAGVGNPGSVDVYNFAEDGRPDPRHIDFMRKAFAATGDRRYWTVNVPGIVDWLHDFLRFRTLPLRNPLWRMRFSTARLEATGYRFRSGMDKAEELALAMLAKQSHESRLSEASGEHVAQK